MAARAGGILRQMERAVWSLEEVLDWLGAAEADAEDPLPPAGQNTTTPVNAHGVLLLGLGAVSVLGGLAILVGYLLAALFHDKLPGSLQGLVPDWTRTSARRWLAGLTYAVSRLWGWGLRAVGLRGTQLDVSVSSVPSFRRLGNQEQSKDHDSYPNQGGLKIGHWLLSPFPSVSMAGGSKKYPIAPEITANTTPITILRRRLAPTVLGWGVASVARALRAPQGEARHAQEVTVVAGKVGQSTPAHRGDDDRVGRQQAKGVAEPLSLIDHPEREGQHLDAQRPKPLSDQVTPAQRADALGVSFEERGDASQRSPQLLRGFPRHEPVVDLGHDRHRGDRLDVSAERALKHDGTARVGSRHMIDEDVGVKEDGLTGWELEQLHGSLGVPETQLRGLRDQPSNALGGSENPKRLRRDAGLGGEDDREGQPAAIRQGEMLPQADDRPGKSNRAIFIDPAHRPRSHREPSSTVFSTIAWPSAAVKALTAPLILFLLGLAAAAGAEEGARANLVRAGIGALWLGLLGAVLVAAAVGTGLALFHDQLPGSLQGLVPDWTRTSARRWLARRVYGLSLLSTDSSRWTKFLQIDDAFVAAERVVAQVGEVGIARNQHAAPPASQREHLAISRLGMVELSERGATEAGLAQSRSGGTPDAVVQEEGRQNSGPVGVNGVSGHVELFTGEPLVGEGNAGLNVADRQVGIPLTTDSLGRHPGGKQFQDVGNPDPGSPDAGLAVQNARIDGDPALHVTSITAGSEPVNAATATAHAGQPTASPTTPVRAWLTPLLTTTLLVGLAAAVRAEDGTKLSDPQTWGWVLGGLAVAVLVADRKS